MRLRLSSVGLHGQFPASGLQETHQVTLPNQQRNETIKNINNKNEKEIKKVSKKTEKVLYVTIKYFVVHTTSIAQLIPAVVTTIEPHELLVNTFGLNQRVSAVPGVGDIKSSILHASESLSFELVAPAAGLMQAVTTIQDFPPNQFSTFPTKLGGGALVLLATPTSKSTKSAQVSCKLVLLAAPSAELVANHALVGSVPVLLGAPSIEITANHPLGGGGVMLLDVSSKGFTTGHVLFGDVFVLLFTSLTELDGSTLVLQAALSNELAAGSTEAGGVSSKAGIGHRQSPPLVCAEYDIIAMSAVAWVGVPLSSSLKATTSGDIPGNISKAAFGTEHPEVSDGRKPLILPSQQPVSNYDRVILSGLVPAVDDDGVLAPFANMTVANTAPRTVLVGDPAANLVVAGHHALAPHVCVPSMSMVASTANTLPPAPGDGEGGRYAPIVAEYSIVALGSGTLPTSANAWLWFVSSFFWSTKKKVSSPKTRWQTLIWKYLICAVVLSCVVPCIGTSTNEKEISRVGAKGKDVNDSAGIVATVKEFVVGNFQSLRSVQDLHRSGETETAGAKLKSLVGNVNTLIETSDKMIQGTGLDGFQESFDDISTGSFVFENIPNKLLGDSIQPEVLHRLVEFNGNLAESLENIDQSNPTGKTQSQGSTERHHQSQASDGGTSGHTDFNEQTQFNQVFPNLLKGVSLPKVSKHFPAHVHEIVMVKHQLRQDALGNGVCAPACNVDDWECNCDKLFDCVRNITTYDMQILFAGGYIDTTPGSSTHGEFKVDVRDINLFEADQDVKQKLIDVQALVENSVELNPRRVAITGVAGYTVPGSNYVGAGLYFEFEPSHFEALWSLENGVYFVKQCGEDGTETWSGSINMGFAYGAYHGRRSTGFAAGQWTVNDYIVNLEDECVTRKVHLNPSRLNIEGVAGYTDVEGVYFDVNQYLFDAVFSNMNFMTRTRLSQTEGIYSAKQCDEYGREIWSGSINVGRAHGSWYGRRSTGPAAGQWNVNDYIVRSDRADGCVIDERRYCTAVLQHFYSACDVLDSSCQQANQQTFQSTAGQVCEAVRSPIKLKFEATGDEFDGFVDTSDLTTCSPLSYDTCEEFIRQFDRLYAGRDISVYPLTNPMVKGDRVHAQTELEIDDVQFPIGYTFPQDVFTGVIDRSFSGTSSYGDQLQPVYDKIFSLVNPTTGKALTLPTNPNFHPNRYAIREHNVLWYINSNADISWSWVEVFQCQENCNVDPHCAFFIYDNNRGRCTLQVEDERAEPGLCENNFDYNNVVCPWSGCHTSTYHQLCASFNIYFKGNNHSHRDFSTTYLIQQEYEQGNIDQQFKLTEDDQLESVRYAEKYITERHTGCEGVIGLGLKSARPKTRSDGWALGVYVTGAGFPAADGTYNFAWPGRWDCVNCALECWIEQNGGLVNSMFISCLQLSGSPRLYGSESHIYNGDGCDDYQDPSTCTFGRRASYLEPIPRVRAHRNMATHTWDTLEHDYQEWRSHPHGLVNRRYDERCEYGDSTFTSIKENSFENITSFEHISFWFVDEVGQALTVGSDLALEMQQFDDTDPHQMFQISRCLVSDQYCFGNHHPTTGYSHDDVFKIRSVLDTAQEVYFWQCQNPHMDRPFYPDWLAVCGHIPFDAAACVAASENLSENLRVSHDVDIINEPLRNQWKLSADGKLESIGCPDEDLLDVSTWRVMTNDVVLLKAGHHDPSTQMWSPVFAGTGYSLALLPGFPGNLDTNGGCLTSSYDRSLAKSAMRSCDESMTYLLGTQASVGRLKAIADVITNDSSRMPGYCCLDDAANSAFFGYAYDPKYYSTGNSGNTGEDNIPMQCQHHGPWHLGISAEACKNMAGEWFRTPCLTLKETIDSRPSRFNLDTPTDGSCQDEMDRLETAYVSASMHHQLFIYESTTTGCTQFCQSLPNYPSQTGMMVTHQETCTCIYPNGKVPYIEGLPSYATPSPPVFTLVDSMGMALGLRPNIDCNSEDALSIETQVSAPARLGQQFQLTHHGQVVSVHCPEMVLSAVVEMDNSCSDQAGLHMLRPTSTVTQQQQWHFNNVTGSITNIMCPGLAISSNKELKPVQKSVYFTLPFSQTGLVIGVVDDCTSIETQLESPGSLNQKFLHTEENYLLSLMCNKIIAVPDCAAANTNGLILSARVDIIGVAGYNDHGEGLYFDFEPFDFEALGLGLENGIYSVKQCGLVARVVITGVAGYNDDSEEGVYFDIAPSHFDALGSALENGGQYSVKQCSEDGRETWSGSINVLRANGPWSLWYGRRSMGPAAGQWTVNDYIVNLEDQCGTHMYTETWSGSISVGRAHGLWYGRRQTGPAAGQWNVNDYIVKPEDECGSHMWTFVGEEKRIQSVECADMFISIGGSSRGGARTVMMPLHHNKGVDLSTQEEMSLSSTLREVEGPEIITDPGAEDDNSVFNNATFTQAANEQTVIEWSNVVLPTSGSQITLSRLDDGLYQSCEKKYQMFERLVGPFSIISTTRSAESALNLAITVDGSVCRAGMGLVYQTDNHTNTQQQFYLGQHGAIFSSFCPGLVISADEGVPRSITLEPVQLDTPRMKWNHASGMIESAANPGMVVANTLSGRAMTLQNSTAASTANKSWKRINTRLVDVNEDDHASWRQAWTVSFITPVSDNNPSFSTLEESIVGDGSKRCYRPNTAFSASFDGFARGLTINDASDEKQCRDTREALGFDKDHPFDTEVRETFLKFMCDQFFTGVDHMMDPSFTGVMDPSFTGDVDPSTNEDGTDRLHRPPQFKMGVHTAVEYEAVEYNGQVPPTTIDYEQFSGEHTDDRELENEATVLPEDPVSVSDIGNAQDLDYKFELTELQSVWIAAGAAMKMAELQHAIVPDVTDITCDIIPETICAAFCATNPSHNACKAFALFAISISFALLVAATVVWQAFDAAYEITTMSDAEAYYGYHYSRATYLDMTQHNTFMVGAFKTIKTSMTDQHHEMKRQLQVRHREIADHLGNDVANAQNALGSAIVGAQNQLGHHLVTTQNALGNQIVDSENRLGHQLMDAQNFITLQHNGLSGWLHQSLCLLFARDGITCEAFVGPLEENQSLIPVEFHSPEGHLTSMERLEGKVEAIQEAMKDTKDIKDEMKDLKDEMKDIKDMIFSLLQHNKERMHVSTE